MSEGYRFLNIPVDPDGKVVVDKETSIREFATYFLMRVMKMFRWENLPEEIPVDCLNKMLLTEGFVFFTKYKSKDLTGEERDQYYVFRGHMGDVIDAYYRPTKIIIANPGANCFEDFELNKQKGGTYYGEKGVILRNDTLYHGLMPMISRYAYLLAENVITMHSADVFLRIIAMISAQDDKTVLSANEFIKGIEQGKLSAVAEGKFFEGVKLQSPPSNNGSYLTQFIEYQQYFLGSFFNEIGLNANFNMKRESIAKSESSLNEDSMLPLCQNMLMCRQEDIKVINEMFGLNIKVGFDSAWLQNAIEIVKELEAMGKDFGGNGAIQIAGKGQNDKATEENQGSEKMVESSGEQSDGSGSNSSGTGSREEGLREGNAEPEEEGQTEENGVLEPEKDPKDEKLEELAEIAAGLHETLNDSEEQEESEEKKDEGVE